MAAKEVKFSADAGLIPHAKRLQARRRHFSSFR